MQTGNPLAEAIEQWFTDERAFGDGASRAHVRHEQIVGNQNGGDPFGGWMSAGKLYDHLKPYSRGDDYEFKNPKTLSHALRRSHRAFRLRFGLKIERPTSKPAKYRFDPTKEQLDSLLGDGTDGEGKDGS